MLNLTAPLNQLGFGVHSLNLALALERAGKEPALWPIGPIDLPQEHADTVRTQIARQATYASGSPSLRIFHPFDAAQHVGKGYHALYTFFELDRFKPRERHHLARQDVLFVPSGWAKEIVLKELPHFAGEVKVARPGVDRSIFHPDVQPLLEFHGNPTVFLAMGKYEVRKGHFELCEAFKKAFLSDDDVVLVLNCFNPCLPSLDAVRRYNDEWNAYFKNSLGDRVHIISERLPTQQHVAALTASADCLVLPARAEGWGMSGPDGLSMGKHLITTDYASHTEYATKENSFLVEVDELEVGHDGQWFNADDPVWEGNSGQWAKLGDAQMDQLVEHLRTVHKKKQSGELLLNRAGIETAERLAWEACAQSVCEALGI